jgi:hypothetical protein
MNASQAAGGVAFSLNKEEALVLFEMLQRLVDEDETKLLPLLHSSAEFAVLCRMNNHLEKNLPEALLDTYNDLLRAARALIVRQSGAYNGIEEI